MAAAEPGIVIHAAAGWRGCCCGEVWHGRHDSRYQTPTPPALEDAHKIKEHAFTRNAQGHVLPHVGQWLTHAHTRCTVFPSACAVIYIPKCNKLTLLSMTDTYTHMYIHLARMLHSAIKPMNSTKVHNPLRNSYAGLTFNSSYAHTLH